MYCAATQRSSRFHNYSLPRLLLFSRVHLDSYSFNNIYSVFLIVVHPDTKFVARRGPPVSSPTCPRNFLSEFASGFIAADRSLFVSSSSSLPAGLIAITECYTRSKIHSRQSSEFTPRYLIQPVTNILSSSLGCHSTRVGLFSKMSEPVSLFFFP